MRPMQLTPENRLRPIRKFGKFTGFNEAGAINAGKPLPPCSLPRSSIRYFNEADAMNAGKQVGHMNDDFGKLLQ